MMSWKTIWRSLKNKDMQKRLAIVVGIIVVYRFLAHIPVPLAEPTQLREAINAVLGQTDLGGFLNLLSGGALASFSIVLVGLSPFITASIVTQLLTKAIPKLEEMHKDGESGRKKIQQWTRRISVPLAIIVAFILFCIMVKNTYIDNDRVIWKVLMALMTKLPLAFLWVINLISLIKPSGQTARQRRESRANALLILAIITPIIGLLVADKSGALFNPKQWIKGKRIGSIRNHI
jgi:preprotein translocase subunit SecY